MAKALRSKSGPSKSRKKERVRARVSAHRERQRKTGKKLLQVWVHDPTSPDFKAEARRQSRDAAASPHAAEDQAFVDAISIWGDL